MDNFSKDQIIQSQITGSIYDARGYVGDCGYDSSAKESVAARFSDSRQYSQGQLRQHLISTIESKGLDVVGMLTVSPHWKSDRSRCDAIAKCIFECIKLRYLRRDIPVTYLAFYEQNSNNPGFHIHLLFFMLPTDKGCLGKTTLTKGVKDAVQSLYGQDFITQVQLEDPEFHCSLYHFAIRKPYDPHQNKWHLLKDHRHIPNGRDGLKWSVVGVYQLDADGKHRDHFDGFYGWRGLVAYGTKHMFTENDFLENTDIFAYRALLNSPDSAPIEKVDLTQFFPK